MIKEPKENSQKKAEKNFVCENPNHQVVGHIELCCITPQPESEGVDRKTLENKLVKFYWAPCQDGKGNTDLDLVDGSDDFSSIPTNSKGKIQLEIGELRDIISEAFKVISVAQDIISRKDQKQKDKEGLIQMAEAGEYEELRGCVESYFANKPI